jgi:hypothetical protein
MTEALFWTCLTKAKQKGGGIRTDGGQDCEWEGCVEAGGDGSGGICAKDEEWIVGTDKEAMEAVEAWGSCPVNAMPLLPMQLQSNGAS